MTTAVVPATSPSDPDREAWLERRLRPLLGSSLWSDIGTRALYSSDSSNYRVLPSLVAAPASVEQLAEVVGLSAEAGIPVTMRGTGTSIAGNAVGPGLVIDTSRYLTAVLDIDPTSRTATVQPGVVLDDLNRHAARYGLRVGPDPSTHNRCTVGGMVGNNACGSRSVRWGTTAENTVSLELIRADGSRATIGPAGTPIRGTSQELEAHLREMVETNRALVRRELPPWPRRVSGYGLDWLLPERGFDLAKSLVGTEGTCAVVAAATLRLVERPAARCLLVLGFPDDVAAAAAVPALLAAHPSTVEGVTAELLHHAGDRQGFDLLPDGAAWLFVEAVGDTAAEARAHARSLAATVAVPLDAPTLRLHEDERAQAALWRVREDGAGRATRLADGSPGWPGFEDAAVPPERLSAYLAAFHRLLADHALRGTTYGHFGEGCVHVRIGFGFDRPGGVERFGQFMAAAADLLVAHGGTLSGEHGDGRARSALLPRMFSPELRALFAQFKSIWDPAGLLNPGVIVDPAPLDRDLRPTAPTLIDLRPKLAFATDDGDFRAAVQRCVGVGRCVTRTGAGLMCPSFRATGDERDSTRGRARSLQEMVSGSLAPGGWRSREVAATLDLCLSCKGCVSECPTGVDMAHYKSEFLYHHYRRRIRPLSHYSLGWLPLWLRLTRRIPRLVNLVTHGSVISRAFAGLAGIAPERTIPRLPPRTFVRSLPRLSAVEPSRGRVVLWPDTFNNYLSPEVANAGYAVLTAARFEVSMPASPVCCGLTWLTTGQLDQARRVVRASLGAPELAGEEPVLVLEPSCAAALRTDLPELLPDDPRAARLARRVTTLAELLDGVDLPIGIGAPTHAVVQPHCHQQAVLGFDPDRRLLERAGIEVETTVGGCCGLAGNFGAERGHEAISRAVAELELLPALEQAGATTDVLADGFSCRTQIEYLSGRRARHIAQVLADKLLPE